MNSELFDSAAQPQTLLNDRVENNPEFVKGERLDSGVGWLNDSVSVAISH